MRKSMNKTTVIIVLTFFLVLSVGYALFSDTITIEGTATAQGEFKVDKICTPGFPSELQNIFAEDEANEVGYFDDYCTVTTDGIEFGTNLAHPGALRSFTLKIKNNNDFTVRLDQDSINSSTIKTLDGVEYDCEAGDAGDQQCKKIPITVGLGDIYFVQNGELYGKEELDITPGETMYVVFYTEWSSGDTGELTNNKLISAKTNMSFDLLQLTD